MLVGACVRATLTTASTQARSHNSVSFGQRLTAGGQYCVLYSTSDLKRGDLPREVSMGKMRGPGACGATFAYSFPLPNVLSKSFVSKTVVEKEGLPRDNPYGLGAGGPRFKSGARPNLIEISKLQTPNFRSAAFWCKLGTFGNVHAEKIARKHYLSSRK